MRLMKDPIAPANPQSCFPFRHQKIVKSFLIDITRCLLIGIRDLFDIHTMITTNFPYDFFKRMSCLVGASTLLAMTSAHAQVQNGLLNYWSLDGSAIDEATTVIGATGESQDNGNINGSITFSDAETDGLGVNFGQVGNFQQCGRKSRNGLVLMTMWSL